MPREIKFRAWDKENKEMLYFDDPIISRPTRGGFGTVPKQDFWSDKGGVRNARLDFSNHENNDFNETVESELMQYTGLKDKNGKEIYEGDVVKVLNVYDKVNFGGSISVEIKEVKWKERGWLPFIESGGIDCDYSYDIHNCKIIGNIYENPELQNG